MTADPAVRKSPASLRATVSPRRGIQIPTVAEFGNDADDDAEDAFFLSAHARTPLAPQRGREGEEGGGLDERREETERLRSMRTLGRKDTHT